MFLLSLYKVVRKRDYAIVAGNGGLGDYLAMSGAVRWLHSQPDRESTYFACSPYRITNVKYLFRDLDNFHIVKYGSSPMGFIKGSRSRRRKMHVTLWGGFQRWQGRLLRQGLDHRNNHWLEGWYKEIGVPYRAKYENFYVRRDEEREEAVFKRLGIDPSEKYKLIIKDRVTTKWKTKQRFKPSTSLPTGFKQINPNNIAWNRHTLIFDWMGVIENANILETVDTGWMHLMKLMMLKPKEDRVKIINASRGVPCIQGKYFNDDWDNGWVIT
jgi:hypothetical protein